ncbi:MAG: chromosome segregation protein SMC [Gemmatimonadota bacterium]|nr:chromosome segregation protein SMC [Gemmatimonadota bacterium]
MKLTKLELSGFKSFADTVSLTFDAGVTSIVGPNGCGKSNVSDAVRWVLGEQSARQLRGGKMEDVIFQGSAHRRPVNVTEVSLFLDNSDGTLPIAYQEVVITRRLSRSGQSDYLLNKAPVRLRDIQDLLRGTGMGSDAGVVIEAKMIDLLLSDRADERRSLFEEAAGIGLYRDRKHSTERRLEETQTDLQRLEDLIGEVQSQIRSLARQKGKTERHARLMEEKFSLQVTLATRLLSELDEQVGGMRQRHAELAEALPALRAALIELTGNRDRLMRQRMQAEEERSTQAHGVSELQLAIGRLEGDLGIAAERLGNAAVRRVRAEEERVQAGVRLQQATVERESAQLERADADASRTQVQAELQARASTEEEVRVRLSAHRAQVRTLEEELQRQAQRLRTLEGERAALESELAALRDGAAQEQGHLAHLQSEREQAEARRTAAAMGAEQLSLAAQAAAAAAERTRHQVAELREREASERAERRQAEESVAQLVARRQALEELERERVGLAPGAAALMAVKDQFDDAVLGPLSDFVSTDRADAELAERLLGEWMHAVLVKSTDAVRAIQAWHAGSGAGTLVLLPAEPGHAPRGEHPLEARLRAQGPAAEWIRALLAGSELLDGVGHAFRRASGAIVLSGSAGASGPLRRRAELVQVTGDGEAQAATLAAAVGRIEMTIAALVAAEQASLAATQELNQAREAERVGIAAREDAARLVGNLGRECGEAETRLTRIGERLGRAEQRLREVDLGLTDCELTGARLEATLGTGRGALGELEIEQETAREARVHWQVQDAHISARVQSASERLERADQTIAGAERDTLALSGEIDRLDADTASLRAQVAQWEEARAERQLALVESKAAAATAEEQLKLASNALEAAESATAAGREKLDQQNNEFHQLELDLSEATGRRLLITDRIESEWKAPLEQLSRTAELLDLDRELLESEASRVVEALEAIGPVNPLAMEEHAEESKRLEFLTTQRDDLVAARQSLLQAIKEIDGTARVMFLETFAAIQGHFVHVFHTLFGGGECELRLASTDDPLESEIEIHAAPRGKRTQRIHLLSSGERTLVATSLLFAIYLTKPSPFCLMDEVDAPLDDANVGRFTTLLSEFKDRTQFLVITHNPRTMQSADAVYGVTMQEPGVSTIVGVRLGDSHTAAA